MDGDLATRARARPRARRCRRSTGLAIGRYDEERSIYTAPEFETPDGRWRTRHMAVDVFAPAGTPVYAPLDGVVERRENRDQLGDYGGLLVLRHGDRSGRCTAISTRRRWPPARCERATRSPGSAAPEVNGGWEPHLHLQLFTDLVGDLPGVALPEEADVWRSVCPDPNLLLGLPGGTARAAAAAGHRGAPLAR